MTDQQEFEAFLRKYVESNKDIDYIPYIVEISIKFQGSVKRYGRFKKTLKNKYDIKVEREDKKIILKPIEGTGNMFIRRLIGNRKRYHLTKRERSKEELDSGLSKRV